MKTRLLLAMLVVILVTVLSMVVLAQVNAAREVYSFMFRGGMSGLDSMVSSLEQYHSANKSWVGVDRFMINLEPRPGMMTGFGMGRRGSGQEVMHPDAILTDVNGNILAETGNPSILRTIPTTELEAAIPLQNNDQVIGYLYASGGVNLKPGSEKPLVIRLNQMAWNAALIGAGIAIILSFVLGTWFLKPVSRLTRAASALGRGDLSQRVPQNGKDELAQLAQSFNQMAESLQTAEINRKAMTADIAHELRTPLSIQRANLEAMEDGVYPLTSDNLKPVLEQNILLSRLVDDLRILALADAGELRLDMISTDLNLLVTRLVNRFQPQATAQQVDLSVNVPDETIHATIDPMRIEQVLTNMIGNAFRFTPVDGQIQVHLEQGKDSLSISVTDSGPGIPEDELPRIFERFYRVDKARARDLGGSGLGLAISRQLARAHGGDIQAENVPEGGARFTLILPQKG